MDNNSIILDEDLIDIFHFIEYNEFIVIDH